MGSDAASSVTSTITDSLTTTTTVKTETYASLKHSALENASSEEDFNSTGIVAKPDMTGQLDRFATTGTQRNPDDDGTLWRVQVGKSSSTRKS